LEKRKVGILCHGYNLFSSDWQEIVWGVPAVLMGRVPRAVLLALEERADILVFGTGASEKDGVKEGEYIKRYLLDHFYDLRYFEEMKHVGLNEFNFIRSISVSETTSMNTAQEALCSSRLLSAAGVNKMFVVSSPAHERSRRDNLVALRDNKELWPLIRGLSIVASDTGPDPDKVIILEPAWGGAKPDRLYQIVRAIQAKPAEEQQKIIDAILAS